jgi:hypothetical protein
MVNQQNKMYKYITVLIICLISLPTYSLALTSTNDATLRLQVPHTFGIVIEKGKVDLKSKLWDENILDAEKSEAESSSSELTTSGSSYMTVSPTEIDFGTHDPRWNNFSEPEDLYTITVRCFTNENDYWHLKMKCDSNFKLTTNSEVYIPFADGDWTNFGWEYTGFGQGQNDGIGEYLGKPGDNQYRPNQNPLTMNQHTKEERVLYNSAWKETGATIQFWNGLQIPFDQKATGESENYSTNIMLTFYAD